MKTYDEIAQNLFERRDEYLKEQKAKKSKLKRGIVSTACIFAVALAVFGVWKSGIFTDNHKIGAPVPEVTESKTEQQVNTTKQQVNTTESAESKTEPVTEKSKENQTTTVAQENRKTADRDVGDYDYNDKNIITRSDDAGTYGMPCYAMPENGNYTLSYPVQLSVQKYGSSKKYLLTITIAKDGAGVSDAEKSAEFKRLRDAGCEIKKYKLWTYAGEDAHKEYYTQIGGVFTKEQLETLFTGREYGYFFDFMNNGDSSPATVSDGGEFFEKTTQKDQSYPNAYN